MIYVTLLGFHPKCVVLFQFMNFISTFPISIPSSFPNIFNDQLSYLQTCINKTLDIFTSKKGVHNLIYPYEKAASNVSLQAPYLATHGPLFPSAARSPCGASFPAPSASQRDAFCKVFSYVFFHFNAQFHLECGNSKRFSFFYCSSPFVQKCAECSCKRS